MCVYIYIYIERERYRERERWELGVCANLRIASSSPSAPRDASHIDKNTHEDSLPARDRQGKRASNGR